MPPELNLADQPMLVGIAVLIVLAILAVLVLRKSQRRRAARDAWSSASDALGIELLPNGSDLGPRARGRVNSHIVTIAPVKQSAKRGKNKRGNKQRSTQCSVKFEAPEAPKFRLTKRDDNSEPIIDTGNPKFDAVVSVLTDQPELLSRYLTNSRRAAMLRLLTYWPSAQITNREAHLLTAGIELDADALVNSICHLVAAAETFDRPTSASTSATAVAGAHCPSQPAGADASDQSTANHITELQVSDEQHSDEPAPAAAGETTAGQDAVAPDDGPKVDGESDLLTEIRLDEATVLQDLFNSDLSKTSISARFRQVYQGREVNWTGEVLRVGAVDNGIQRIAVLIGSADGSNPRSGRVVALTSIKPRESISAGDVVAFSGELVNLDVPQRLFHVNA